MKKTLIYILVVVLVVGAVGAFFNFINPTLNSSEQMTETQEFHIHADLLILINGEAVDLSSDTYQTNQNDVKSGVVHLHDNNGVVVHVHAPGVRLGDFLTSINFGLSDTCLQVEKEYYCEDESNNLVVWVNGAEIPVAAEYIMQDLDRILISFGDNDRELEEEYARVTDEACIYSELCPERGEPPSENCVGGLGSTCAL
jgi:hypothetical protein